MTLLLLAALIAAGLLVCFAMERARRKGQPIRCQIFGHTYRKHLRRSVCKRCGKFITEMGPIPKRRAW